MNSNTHTAQAVVAEFHGGPEFATLQQASRLFGIGRSSLYQLEAEGAIRLARVRRKGRVLGRVLVDCASVRAYLARCTEGGK